MTVRIPAQSVRRHHVIVLALSYPIVSWALWMTLRENVFFALAHLAATALIFWLVAVKRVARIGRLIGDDLDSRLDERQLALRNAAYLDAYRIAGGVILIGVIWIALGLDLGIWWVPSTYNEWTIIFWGLFIYLMTLPSAFLVWREPDRTDDLELQDA